jgi:hypothetical protein
VPPKSRQFVQSGSVCRAGGGPVGLRGGRFPPHAARRAQLRTYSVFQLVCANLSTVMPGLVPGIHALDAKKDVDGRDKPGHDDV